MVGGGLGLVREGLGGIGYEVVFFDPLRVDLFPASHVEAVFVLWGEVRNDCRLSRRGTEGVGFRYIFWGPLCKLLWQLCPVATSRREELEITGSGQRGVSPCYRGVQMPQLCGAESE